MAWPLPTLPNPLREAQKAPAPQGTAAPEKGKKEPGQDPLTALWMLSQQQGGANPAPPAQGLGAEFSMARAGTPTSYDQPQATPLSDAANPFNTQKLAARHEQFTQRFPWMGE